MAVTKQPYVSPQDYLEQERKAETRSEYINGQVIALPPMGQAHNLIKTNLIGTIWTCVRGKGSGAYTDMRVRVESASAYLYPDFIIVRGDPRFEDAGMDNLMNPAVLIEIFSPATDAYDRGTKFGYYRQLDSLLEYITIDQDHPHIEHYSLQKDGSWRFTVTDDPKAVLRLDAIDCDLPLSEIYHQVRFPSAEAADERG